MYQVPPPSPHPTTTTAPPTKKQKLSTTTTVTTMSALTKIFDPVMKVAARTYQGMLASELNKMGTYLTITNSNIGMRER